MKIKIPRAKYRTIKIPAHIYALAEEMGRQLQIAGAKLDPVPGVSVNWKEATSVGCVAAMGVNCLNFLWFLNETVLPVDVRERIGVLAIKGDHFGKAKKS